MDEYVQNIIEHARQIQYKAEHIARRRSIPEITQGLEEIYEEMKRVFHNYRILKKQMSGKDCTFEDFLKEEGLKDRYEERGEDF